MFADRGVAPRLALWGTLPPHRQTGAGVTTPGALWSVTQVFKLFVGLFAHRVSLLKVALRVQVEACGTATLGRHVCHLAGVCSCLVSDRAVVRVDVGV